MTIGFNATEEERNMIRTIQGILGTRSLSSTLRAMLPLFLASKLPIDKFNRQNKITSLPAPRGITRNLK